ncbi:UNVERIFIED_CONTAM: hypothetical protein Sradi_0221700 [Sesamum radiatum]|uniref:Uncharacterized protein n=1 Tax=Sesamum radiatum TaxID=300843 RepID=A0AAW2W198_SESRA
MIPHPGLLEGEAGEEGNMTSRVAAKSGRAGLGPLRGRSRQSRSSSLTFLIAGRRSASRRPCSRRGQGSSVLIP